ncbi:hypothetical protein FRC07_003368 [Ceratobasidium sp. 392]|nr:hypothetical protein FRC07_003368 [Ceratobasidium sp. 392]
MDPRYSAIMRTDQVTEDTAAISSASEAATKLNSAKFNKSAEFPPYLNTQIDDWPNYGKRRDRGGFRRGDDFDAGRDNGYGPRGGRPPRLSRDGAVRDDLIEQRLKRETPCRMLFVRQIQYETDSDSVRKQFEEFGEIKTFFDLISNRGMAFVTYYDVRAAERARERLQDSNISGRPIDVHYSLPRGDEQAGRCERDKNQGTLLIALRQSNQSIDDHELRRRFSQFGDVKQITAVDGRSDQRLLEMYDSRAMETAHDHLQGQPLQDGVMYIEFAWDVPETPLPPGPVPGSNLKNASMVVTPAIHPAAVVAAEVGVGTVEITMIEIGRETVLGIVTADAPVVLVAAIGMTTDKGVEADNDYHGGSGGYESPNSGSASLLISEKVRQLLAALKQHQATPTLLPMPPPTANQVLATPPELSKLPRLQAKRSGELAESPAPPIIVMNDGGLATGIQMKEKAAKPSSQITSLLDGPSNLSSIWSEETILRFPPTTDDVVAISATTTYQAVANILYHKAALAMYIEGGWCEGCV